MSYPRTNGEKFATNVTGQIRMNINSNSFIDFNSHSYLQFRVQCNTPVYPGVIRLTPGVS